MADGITDTAAGPLELTALQNEGVATACEGRRRPLGPQVAAATGTYILGSGVCGGFSEAALIADCTEELVGSTSRLYFTKKSKPRMGLLTAANKKFTRYCFPPKVNVTDCSPHEGISQPSAPTRCWPVGGAEL